MSGIRTDGQRACLRLQNQDRLHEVWHHAPGFHRPAGEAAHRVAANIMVDEDWNLPGTLSSFGLPALF